MNGNDDNAPQVWVGCLACYNAGDLVGEWFDATDAPTDVEDFNQRVEASTRVSNVHILEAHEELWVFDHENFHGLLTGECSPAVAAEIAGVLARVDEPEAFALFVDRELGGYGYAQADWDAAVEQFGDAFCGYFDSEADYAQELADEAGMLSVPNDEYGRRDRRDLSSVWPFSCIDWDRAWNELRIGGDNWSEYVAGKGYAIFRRS